MRDECGRLVLGLWLLTAIASAHAVDTNLLCRGIAEFTAGSDAWDLSALTNAASIMERARASDPASSVACYWAGVAQFHVALREFGDASTSGRAAAQQAMRSAVAALEGAVELNTRDAESHALLSAIYGMRIAASPATALWRGPAVLRHKRLALQYGPDNPRACYLLGMSHIHAPAILGGTKEGLALLLKAERLFEAEREKDKGPLDPRWGYDHCLAFIGRAYLELGEGEKAKAYWLKTLDVSPMNRIARKGLQQCRETTETRE